MQRITISVDDPLAEQFDAMIARKGYSNRSEAFRDLLRTALERDRLTSDRVEFCVATVSYIFDFRERELASRLAAAHHEHHDIVVSSQRISLDHREGLETVILRGEFRKVTSFADTLIAMNGVRHGSMHIVPVDRVKLARSIHPHASDGHVHLRPRN